MATLYNAGEYDSDLAKKCLALVRKKFKKMKRWNDGGVGGHAYYSHLYAAQAFYTAGDEIWADYFPAASKRLLKQQKADGSWMGDGIGFVFGLHVSR